MIARRPNGRLLLVVLLLHGALVGLLWWQRPPAARPSVSAALGAVPAPLWLRWLPEPPAAAGPADRSPVPPPPRMPRRAVPEPEAAARSPQAITVPATAPQAAAAAAPVPPADPAAPAADPLPAARPEPQRPLQLALPPRRAASEPPAALTRDDPRVRDTSSYAERLARGIGTDDRLHESVQPDGTRRFQRGTGCVLARSARAAELDPFNQSARPIPRGISPC